VATLAAAVFALSAAGCDAGSHQFASEGIGPRVHLIATNVAGGTLPSNGPIELSFDRLLLPGSILRQTFVLADANNFAVSPVPVVAYDPVARVVTVTPADGSLQSGQPYTLYIQSPQSPEDPNGLRAIDGAPLSADSQTAIGFMAVDATTPAMLPSIDFCSQVAGLLLDHQCQTCHTTPHSIQTLTYAGLALQTPQDIQQTAIGVVAHGSNTGPFAAPQAPLLQFNVVMPIIDPGPSGGGINATPGATGDPGHSFLIYKMLMAVPVLPDDGAVANVYQVTCSASGDPCPQPLPDDERTRLANMIPGLQMPYPPAVNLTVSELEVFSLWIAQGAPMPSSCQ